MVPHTGQYLIEGRPSKTLQLIGPRIGDDAILTSGARSIVKQTYPFLHKALKTGGNLSRALRSLAPPGYSFHGAGDFAMGHRGLGAAKAERALQSKELTPFDATVCHCLDENRRGIIALNTTLRSLIPSPGMTARRGFVPLTGAG